MHSFYHSSVTFVESFTDHLAIITAGFYILYFTKTLHKLSALTILL